MQLPLSIRHCSGWLPIDSVTAALVSPVPTVSTRFPTAWVSGSATAWVSGSACRVFDHTHDSGDRTWSTDSSVGVLVGPMLACHLPRGLRALLECSGHHECPDDPFVDPDVPLRDRPPSVSL